MQFSDIVLNIVSMGMIYGLTAAGLAVGYGVTGTVNFAYGQWVLSASYLAIFLTSYFGIHPVASVLITVVCFALIAMAVHRLPGRRSADPPEQTRFMLTAAIAMVLTGIHLAASGADQVAMPARYLDLTFEAGGRIIDAVRLIISIGVVGLFALLHFFFYATYAGKAIRACADSPQGAQIIGLDRDKLLKTAMAVSFMCAALAGGALSFVSQVSPSAAPHLTLLSFSIVIIGGMRDFRRLLEAALLISAFETAGVLLLAPSWKPLFSALLFAVIFIIRARKTRSGAVT